MLDRASRQALFALWILFASSLPSAVANASMLPESAASVAGPVAGLSGVGDGLGLSPYWDWKTIETEHFRVTFPAELEAVSQKSARFLEEAHAALSPFLRWEPVHKTQILVIDNTDLANGLTAAVGRIGIVLITTPPENFFSTGYYDDWLRLLVFHEYTHLVNMDATRGFWSALRVLFGDVTLPNSLWPTWMLEGLAVYAETRFTNSGRGRSPYYEMVLRSAVEEDLLDSSKFMTLDKVNGPNPYSPAGETPYLFGYQLMNQITKQKLQGLTADQESNLDKPEDALGIMSIRSAGRFPYLINGNLENIIGIDFYQLWDQWVGETRARMKSQLEKIKSRPVTPVTPLTDPAIELLGVAASPDGKLIAYTEETSDRHMSLYVRELATGKTRHIEEKLLGTNLSFSPDSKRIYFSAIERRGLYALVSDLFVHDLERGSTTRLTTRLRARDPSVSRDGSQLVFTVTANQTTSLALAALIADNEGRDVSLADIQTIHVPSPLGRVSNPIFTADGRSIVFSVHENGVVAEDLLQLDLATRKVTTLARNGKMNRFPTVDPSGTVFFVSDVTGIDNIFRIATSGNGPSAVTQVTNVTTGLALPVFVPTADPTKPRLLANHYTSSGWRVVELGETPTASTGGLNPVELTVPPAPAPDPVESRAAAASNSAADYPVSDYSLWPSILPRQWFFLPTFFPGSIYLQGEVLGFDAIDRHRYLFGTGYDTLTGQLDLLALYENRQFGPTLGLSFSNTTARSFRLLSSSGAYDLLAYDRDLQLTASISLPIQYTYSTLTPYLAFHLERTFRYVPGANPDESDLIAKTVYVPTADAVLIYSSAKSSRLGNGPEEGRSTSLGNRVYFNGGEQIYKAYFADTEYLRVTDHAVLIPQVKASLASSVSSYRDANVVVEGRARRLIASLPTDGFSQLALRGYPERSFFARGALVGGLDFRYPILRVFRGWGTNPLFLEQFYGFVFAESAYFPFHENGLNALPSAGAGVSARLDAFIHLPIVLSGQYNRGLREDAGGVGELIVQLGLGNLPF